MTSLKLRKTHRTFKILWGITGALFILFYIVRRNKETADWIIRYIAAPVRETMGFLTSPLPFSVAEVFYTAVIIGSAVFLILTVREIIRKPGWKEKLRVLGWRLSVLLLIPVMIWTGYSWLWAIGYYGSTFAERSGWTVPGVEFQDLEKAASYFAEEASKRSGKVKRDAEGHFAETDFWENTEDLYTAIEKEFPTLKKRPLNPKPMFYSKIMSAMGFTGFYFPFTGEANVNRDFPPALQPVTIAHEMAHQRRVAAEEEANFVGVTASILSDDVVYQYSGYLQGLMLLSGPLYRASPEAWGRISAELSPQVHQDWQDNSQYWKQFESPVESTATAVYDSYLKHNDQEAGIRSYGECVDLLVLYYKTKTEG